MKNVISCCTDFRDTIYWGVLMKLVDGIQFMLKLDKMVDMIHEDPNMFID
jgi:hypothetical protein